MIGTSAWELFISGNIRGHNSGKHPHAVQHLNTCSTVMELNSRRKGKVLQGGEGHV